MAFILSAFGLRVESNCLFPGPQRVSGDLPADVRLVWGERPAWLASDPALQDSPYYSSPYLNEGGESNLRVWRLRGGAYHRLLYGDGTEFIVDSRGTQVWATWAPEATLEDTATYLMGPIFGLILRLRGTVCLHASAVAVEARALALLGPAGAGKSTTAGAFAQLGYPIFSDDVVPVFERDAAFFVQPAYPHLRLWPDSVDSLFGSSEALPRLTPTWDKRDYDLAENGDRFQGEPLPLAVIYILGDRSDEPRAPFVEPVSPRDALVSLVANTYVNYLLDKDMRAGEFDFLGRVVSRVPLRRVCPHADPQSLGKLCEVIRNDFRALSSSLPRRAEAG